MLHAGAFGDWQKQRIATNTQEDGGVLSCSLSVS